MIGSRASAILFLSLAVEKQPSVEERLFMPRRIVNINHPRGSEGLFVRKDVCIVLQQFLPTCGSDVTVNFTV